MRPDRLRWLRFDLAASRTARGLTLALLAMPAWAQDPCPTPDDLAGGLEVTYSDGAKLTVRATDRPGVLMLESQLSDGRIGWNEVAAGAFSISFAVPTHPSDPPVWVAIHYGVAPEALPRPEPLSRWDGQAVLQRGFNIHNRTEARAYGPLREVTVGACTYQAFDMMFAFDDDGGYASLGHYLPAFGFALRSWNEAGTRPRYTVTATTMRALP